MKKLWAILVFVLALGIIELIARGFGLDPVYLSYSRPSPLKLSEKITRVEPSPLEGEIVPDYPPGIFPDATMQVMPEISKRILMITQEPGDMRSPDPDLGFRLKPRYRGRSTQVNEDGTLNYDVIYSIDSKGRRLTPGQTRPRPHTILLLGTSDVFGHGLNDQETIAARIAAHNSGYRAFTYGLDLWGPVNLLKLVLSPRFADDLEIGEGDEILYVFSELHLLRLTGDLRIYRSFPWWPQFLPRAQVKNGELLVDGWLSDEPVHALKFLLGRSSILSLLNFQLPQTYTQEHFDLFALIFLKMKQRFEEKFPGARFTVLFLPEFSPGINGAMKLNLAGRGVTLLDYSNLNAGHYTKSSLHLPDGHFSSAMTEVLARQISRDLLKSPK